MHEIRGQHLHFDCVSGAAGDMTLGALVDLGVPREVLSEALDRVGVGGHRLSFKPVIKQGIKAMDVRVDVSPERSPTWRGSGDRSSLLCHADIEAMLESADLAPAIRARAQDMFARLAGAEAVLHGVQPAEVVFAADEVIDSIVDIVGTAAGLAWLAPAAVTAASVAVGYGTFTSTEGIKPVPSPAALEILRECGAIIESGHVAMELCTATGAAILAGAVTAWTPMPAMVPVAIGYGAGDADLTGRANVLRVIIGKRALGIRAHTAT